jgi:formylglycine-generating enzyme required for sulfatase activity
MSFSLETWKEQTRAGLRNLGGWLARRRARDAPYLLYGALCGAALAPLATAAAGGELLPVMTALAGVAGGVGGNLIAEQVARAKEHADQRALARWAAQNAPNNPELRAALDAVLSELEVVAEARRALGEEGEAWFVPALREELARLGNLPRFEAALGGVFVAGDVHGDVVTGRKTTGFDQRGQHVERQLYVTGDYVDRRGTPSPEPSPSPEALRHAYLHRLFELVRRLPLTGIDPKAASDEGAGELQLAAVYTALLTQRPAPGEGPPRAAARGDRELGGAEARRLSVVELLNKTPRLVLLGEPGGGKSTFVSFLALCLAGEALGDADVNLARLIAPLPAEEREEKPQPQPWDHGALLPVRVVLRDLAARGLPEPGRPVGAETLWDFIVDELPGPLADYAPYLKKELLEQGGLILLDGLDEVPDAGRRRVQVKRAVADFARCFPGCRFLVTSRTYAYQRQDWKLEGFDEALLSPFTRAQVDAFVDGWYAHVAAVRGMDADDAHGKAALLKSAIGGSERLAELAARPLLLTLMASLHAWRGGSLPEKREALYADTVDLLLDQWESPKVVRDAAGGPLLRQPSLAEWLKVDRAVVRAELNRLAFEAHRDQPQLKGTADLRQERLVALLMRVARNPEVNPARVEEYLRDRAGLLAARGEGVYTFPHRTFQEYLAACHLTDHGFPDALADLLRADPERWREATLLAGAKASRGTASAAWNLAEALCYREPPGEGDPCTDADCWGALLAAQTLAENEKERLAQVSARNRPKLERIRRWLLAIVAGGRLPAVDRAQAGQALALLGDARDFDALVTVPAGPFLMGSADDDEMAFSAEKPQHQVTLPAFKIGTYPVTNQQFGAFVAAGGYGERRYWTEDGWVRKEHDGWREPRAFGAPFDLPNHPVVGVSWYEALAYCGWLTEVWRAQGLIGMEEVVRLPTEAEWEKAARGTDGRRYPWGADPDRERANYGDAGIGSTSAVGCFPGGASPYGCLGMAGNVWEWTSSLWGESLGKPDFVYPYNASDGRENLEAEDAVLRVLRGGAFIDFERYLRCAYRFRYFPYLRLDDVGFRVVVSPISPPSGL